MRAARTIRGVAVVAAALGLWACAQPRLILETDPPTSDVYVDGVRQGEGFLDREQTYYGVTRIDVVPAPRSDPRDAGYYPTRRGVRFEEPITPWIFPLDFIVEVVTTPWRDDVERTRVEALPRLDLPDPRIVAEEVEFEDRAARMLTAR